MTKPKSRPGTRLEGLDLLESKTAHPHAPLDYGQHGHLLWALYPRKARRGADYEVYVLHNGQLLKRNALYRRKKTKRPHPIKGMGDLTSTLWKLYWRTLDRERPLKSLQGHIRRQTREKARKQHHEARMQHWQARWRIKTDYTGRGAHHQVVSR